MGTTKGEGISTLHTQLRVGFLFFTHPGLRGAAEPDAVRAREHRARATMPSDSQSRATHTANLGVIDCAADASARKTISSMESFAADAWVRRPSRDQREG